MILKRLKFLVSLFIIAAIGFMSCKHDIGSVAGTGTGGGGTGTGGGGGTSCDTTKVYFQQQVLPVLISNCAMSGCHDVASQKKGIILTSYQNVMATTDIRPGRPFDSELYEKIVETDPVKRMPPPPANPLSAQQVQLIYNWIQQGAQDLTCQDLCNPNSFTYSVSIRNIISNKCQGCHSGGAPQGGIDLSTYNGVKAKVTDGRLWGAVNHLAGFSPMPKNGAKLSTCEIDQIKNWIATGAPNN